MHRICSKDLFFFDVCSAFDWARDMATYRYLIIINKRVTDNAPKFGDWAQKYGGPKLPFACNNHFLITTTTFFFSNNKYL